ncbi:hypothetical protein CK623_00165 [Vandammella animalimorsus]|uniref:Uncharacterized protein n=1 Tax=Vandammella animalimorsus TaxID=2029117 RepID=A0A2A2AS48_9BURK|nr:hypothetical protein [Vandammella animalimorsus]PAT41400.1 hypothetical protein CK623_00165 [Vandammella animalimorsus]
MFCLDRNLNEVPCSKGADVLYVLTREELMQIANPFYMDMETAAQLGAALLFLMAVAFVFRLIRKALETSDINERSES